MTPHTIQINPPRISQGGLFCLCIHRVVFVHTSLYFPFAKLLAPAVEHHRMLNKVAAVVDNVGHLINHILVLQIGGNDVVETCFSRPETSVNTGIISHREVFHTIVVSRIYINPDYHVKHIDYLPFFPYHPAFAG